MQEEHYEDVELRIYKCQVGTAVVTRGKDRRLALGRLGALVEQLEALVRSGREVILVTSGGVSVGKQKLMQQQVLNSSPLEMQMHNGGQSSIASNDLPLPHKPHRKCIALPGYSSSSMQKLAASIPTSLHHLPLLLLCY